MIMAVERSCHKRCVHFRRSAGGETLCARFPPVHVLSQKVPAPRGISVPGAVAVQHLFVYPPVRADDEACGEYRPRVADPEEAPA